MEVYLDGVQKRDGHLGYWGSVSEFQTSKGLRVIALKCFDEGGGWYGILASLKNEEGETILLTDTNWKCSSVHEEGWEHPEFKDSSGNWQSASKIRDHGNGPWGFRDGISHDADWIWAVGSGSTAYCRGVVKGTFL